MRIFIFSFLCLFSTIAFAEQITIQTATNSATFDVDVADTPQKQQRGLMYIDNLPENKGMIFIDSANRVWTMWMKNTLIPLDMIFFTRDGIIIKITNAKPRDLTVLSSDVPVAGVLEINAGLAQKHGMQIGDTIDLSQLPGYDLKPSN